MSHPFELRFDNAIGTYDALWNFSGRLACDPKVGNVNNWILTFRDGLRGMLARIVAVDQNYSKLHEYQLQSPPDGNPNEWVLHCESHAAVIFFAMDSALECFVFAMNVIGFLRSPQDFRDITDPGALRKIRPRDILGGGRNPTPRYEAVFPRTVAHWKANETLLSAIFEYHHVSKHRAAVVTGGDGEGLRVKDNPKQHGAGMSSAVHTVESMAHSFQKFIDEVLVIAVEEATAAFGYAAIQRTPIK